MNLKTVEETEAKLGIGRFQFSSLLQKRAQELVRGASPLIDTRSDNPIEIALQEIVEGRISLEMYDVSQEEQDLEAALEMSDDDNLDESILDI